ncbi:hypothetical protein BOX15_Mlig005420g1 [Macrostomum lignano]|uniref:TPR_REGION domain-containing protein n=2 Tax=Macrostomum lignano TaxID=282301 RepID=A0A1I8JL30_9PLAT|nr:hypothetical protein BOX15_Mlig005420g1 [Macrostomum lignano]
MSDELKRGQDLMEQAMKKRGGGGGGGFLSGIFGKSAKDDEAAELFVKAANVFKMGKHWREAGDAFSKAAEAHSSKNSRHDSASALVDAANCYRKVDGKQAIGCLDSAIGIYTDMGRFTIAAKHHMSIAEIYETELNDPKLASQHYQKAADFYRGEESNASASKCEAKVAHLDADAGDYINAAKVFEELGKAAMENSLLKYGAKDHFFRACLCHLNIDVLNCQQALEKYAEMHPAFTDSREYKLMVKLVETANPEEPNVDEFTKALTEFDSISRLDPWATRRLNTVKKALKADEPELT